MAPKSYNSNTYKDDIKLDLERLKKNENVQKIKSKCRFKQKQHKNVTRLGWNIK